MEKESIYVHVYPGNGNQIERIKVEPANKFEILKKSKINSFILESYQIYFSSDKSKKCFEKIMNDLLALTRSKFGYVAMKLKNEDGDIFLRNLFVSNIAWNNVIRKTVENALHIDFLNMKTLYGNSVLHSCHVISNNPKTDPRAKGIPPGHPIVRKFLSLVLTDYSGEVIGTIGLGNRKKGYTPELISEMYDIVNAMSNMVYDHHHTMKIREGEGVSKSKDSFLATMSHEIRTPLSGIIGMIQLLKTTQINLTSKQKEYLEKAGECSINLLDLINDILEYQKMNSKRLILNKVPFQLCSCVKEAIEVVKPGAEQKGLKIVENTNMKVEYFYGDRKRIRQILVNLLGNAIKFTDDGYIEIRISTEKVECCDKFSPNKWKIHFEIEDTGIGITPQDQKKIFNVFTQAEEKIYEVHSKGTGLGLAICKELVELMEGNIDVKSDGKSGSIFQFDIYLHDHVDVDSIINENRELLRNKQVLIVDDREEQRIILSELAFNWGMTPIIFSSAKEGLNYLQKAYSTFSVAFIDVRMTPTNGIEMVQEMKNRGYHIPVIGISSVGKDFKGKGWFDYSITKPIDVNRGKLLHYVIQCLERSPQSSDDEMPQEFPSMKRSHSFSELSKDLNILIAEDDENHSIILKEMLKQLGYTSIDNVTNGRDCLEQIKQKKYDFCFMDVKMPIMNGIEATKKIVRMLSHPIIIGVTASVLESDKNQCFEAGMEGYLSKPIQKDQLLEALHLQHLN